MTSRKCWEQKLKTWREKKRLHLINDDFFSSYHWAFLGPSSKGCPQQCSASFGQSAWTTSSCLKVFQVEVWLSPPQWAGTVQSLQPLRCCPVPRWQIGWRGRKTNKGIRNMTLVLEGTVSESSLPILRIRFVLLKISLILSVVIKSRVLHVVFLESWQFFSLT